MQSVAHWETLADEIADSTTQLHLRPDLMPRPVYIADKHREGFPTAFENYLATALANRQIPVTRNPSSPALVLDYGLQRVDHTPFRKRNPFPGLGTVAGLGTWLGYEAANHWTGQDAAVAAIPAGAALDLLSQLGNTNTEIIVTASVSVDGQTLARVARNFYVLDGDAWQYPNIAIALSRYPPDVAPPCRLGEPGCVRVAMDP